MKLHVLMVCCGCLSLGFVLVPAFPPSSWIAPTPLGSMSLWNDCPMNGSIADPNDRMYFTNVLKNRYQKPSSTPFVPFKTMLAAKTDETILSEEGGATIEGYVGKVIYEAKKRKISPGVYVWESESCNCDNAGQMKADDHIYLFKDKNEYLHFKNDKGPDGKLINDKHRVINIETTPRVKELASRAGFDWTKASLDKLVGHKIRVQGWLMNDWKHANASFSDGAPRLKADRGTCWEIHPITSLQVIN